MSRLLRGRLVRGQPQLNVTRQRVDQLVVGLFVRGLLRSADPDAPTFVMALKDDSTILLRQDQERVLSALPETGATTATKIAPATQLPSDRIVVLAESLRKISLVNKTVGANHRDLYHLTAAGAAHWQRLATVRRADIPPLPFRSDRVLGVLSFLDTEGPIRTRDVGLGLGIPQISMNALMQNLKCKNVVRTQTAVRNAPYVLTSDGREILAAMKLARPGQDDALVSAAGPGVPLRQSIRVRA